MRSFAATVPERGLTLIEVMIILVVLAVLSAIAIPNYSRYSARSQLVEATGALADFHAKMERFHREHRSYAHGGECGVPAPVNLASFAIRCEPGADGQSYTATATGIGATSDFVYTIDQSNTRATVALPASWGELPEDARSRWVTR